MFKFSYFILLTTFFGSQITFGSGILPNDKFFPRQWALFNDGSQNVNISVDDSHTIIQTGKAGADIGWLEARDDMNLRAKANVLVAVIDSGIDLNHPDLVGRISTEGWDFLSQKALEDDSVGHGTHISGAIVANADNHLGIAGIAPASVKVLPLKVYSLCSFRSDICFDKDTFKYNNKFVSDYTADAVRYAILHHADVINLSIAWPGIVDTKNARDAFQEALGKGIIIVASAGNDRKIKAPFPCAYKGVICVGAVTNTGDMSIYSNYGGIVDVLAPGDDIISTIPTNRVSQQVEEKGYDLASGTSEATPQVSAIAAAIKSVYPGSTAEEIKARLFGSASKFTKNEKALYGLVNLKKALSPTVPEIFWPDFRSMGSISVDEKNLSAQGKLDIQALHFSSTKVTVQISINGKVLSSTEVAIPANGLFSVPWNYQFDSLDQSSDLKFNVQITGISRTSSSRTSSASLPQTFNYQTLSSRKIEALQGNRLIQGTKSDDWIGKNLLGHYFSKLSKVENIFSSNQTPIYYKQSSADDKNNISVLQLLDVSQNAGASVSIPGIQDINEIVEADFLGDGQPGFVVIGTGTTSNAQGKYLEFCFFNSQWQLLTSLISSSIWQVQLNNNSFIHNILTGYSNGASWVRWLDPSLQRTRLIPAFFSRGFLPDKDNVNGLLLRHYAVENHLYYLAPINKPASSEPTQLEVRAVDNATFRKPYDDLHLVNLIRPSQKFAQAGRVQILAEMGHDLDAPIKIFDVPSIDKPSLAESNWDPISANGAAFDALSSNGNRIGTTFFNIEGPAHGSVALSSGAGDFEGRAEFTYSSPMSPIRDLLGAFSLPTGNYFFFESTFDIVGFAYLGSPVTSLSLQPIIQKFPIERDSSMAESNFSQLFTAVTVGTEVRPLPGIYVDSTWLQGNQVSVMVWDTEKNKMLRPLRYSFEIPEGCAEMPPDHLSDKVESLILPIICQGVSSPTLILTRPSE